MTANLAVLGIDIAKTSFAAAWLLPGQSKFLQRDFQNNAAGHRSLQLWLVKHSSQPCLAGMEATGNYGLQLLHRLHEDGHRCSLLQPRHVKSHMLARGQGNKTDRQDAIAIAHFISVHQPRQWLPPNAQRRQLKELFQVLVALKTDMKRHKHCHSAALGGQVRLIWTSMIAMLECQIQKTTGKIMALVSDDRHSALEQAQSCPVRSAACAVRPLRLFAHKLPPMSGKGARK